MSSTPRTDALIETLDNLPRALAEEKWPQLCRALERENAALRKDQEQLNALETAFRECPHAELGFNSEEEEGPVGFTFEIDGCDPLLLAGDTLRDVLAGLVEETRKQSAE